MAGPAPGRPKVPTAWLPPIRRSSTGAFRMDGYVELEPGGGGAG